MLARRIAAPTVHEHQNRARLWIVISPSPIPPTSDRIARELSGIPAGTDVDVGLILHYIINRMGNRHPLR